MMTNEETVIETESDSDSESERTCWICFGRESENPRAKWLHPCQCCGSTKWVHESCLYRWIDEKQNGDSRKKVYCMQCRMEYLMLFPRVSRMAIILEGCQDLIQKCSSFVAVTAFMGFVYWTAVTFGGFTVIQVFGHQRGIELMENGDPIFLLIGLPIIPVALVLTRLIRWEEAVLRLWNNRHRIVRKLPFIKRFLDAQSDDGYRATPAVPNDPINISRTICGAIILPSIANLMGNSFFIFMATPHYRTLLGGLTFIGLKGFLKIYLRQKQYLNKTQRHIMDYTEDNLEISMNNQSQSQSLTNLRQAAGFQDDYSPIFGFDVVIEFIWLV